MEIKQKIAVFTALGIVILMNGAGMVSAEVSVSGTINFIICKLVEVLYYIAAGIALIIIVLAGIKWSASGDDPGARKSAKDSVIHAMIGLIIVLVAGSLIGWVTTGTGIGDIRTGLASVVSGTCSNSSTSSNNTVIPPTTSCINMGDPCTVGGTACCSGPFVPTCVGNVCCVGANVNVGFGNENLCCNSPSAGTTICM